MHSPSNGDTIVLAAAAAAIQISRGKSVEDLGLMSAFFGSLASNLALIALKSPADITSEQNPNKG